MTRPTRGPGRSSAGPSPRSWQERLDDPGEPLYTLAIAADLLGVDVQVIRRLEAQSGLTSTRPSGNQRRYSRTDLGILSRAHDLARTGTQGQAIARILQLEDELDELRRAEAHPTPEP